MKVDCHIHSLYSDGIYTVREIIEMLLHRNIQIFSLTDHDKVAGTKEARDLSRGKIGFISGIEITGREMEIHKIKKTFSVHLLGYHFDENNITLTEVLKNREEQVIKIYDDLCGELTALGYPVLREEVPISCGNELQLCDIAAYVREKNVDVSKHIFDTIDGYASKLDSVNISVEDAVNYIHAAGGKAVWAHPFYVYKDYTKKSINEEEFLTTLEILKDLGIDGIEAYYSAFDDHRRKWLYSLACSENMIYTAGSDFHGFTGRDFMGIEIDFDSAVLSQFL